MSAEDVAKVLTAFGASGIAAIVTAITTLIVNRYNWKKFEYIQEKEDRLGRHRKTEPPSEEPTGEN